MAWLETRTHGPVTLLSRFSHTAVDCDETHFSCG